MTEREAIVALTELVGHIAERCWENIGTDGVKRLLEQLGEIHEAMSQ